MTGSEGANYQDQLRAEIAAGTALDVFWIPGTDVADFATRGLILNAANLAANTDGFAVTDFYEGPMYHLTFNPETSTTGADSGALWGLPRDVSTFALYLNMDLINEAGAPDPRELAANGEWNWESFLEVSQATRALGSVIYGGSCVRRVRFPSPTLESVFYAGVGGRSLTSAHCLQMSLYGYGASVWLNASGGGFFNEDRTACALNTEESLAGLDSSARAIKTMMLPLRTVKILNPVSVLVRLPCSRMVAGLLRVSAPWTSTGTSHLILCIKSAPATQKLRCGAMSLSESAYHFRFLPCKISCET
ncbi:MAG: extracellular solute-binding protein [Chloroflexi bacterium]|nr:extracellular solute-binding protein [Chloroflexota bacterium]